MRIVVLLLVSSSLPALADVAPPAPEDLDCPRGAKGEGNGVSVWCEPTICTDDASCGDGYRCSDEDIGLCVEPIEVATERVRPSLDPDSPAPAVPTATVRSVRRRGCEPDGTCLNVDSTCEQSRRCVPVDSEPDVPSTAIVEPTATSRAEQPAAASSGCACRTGNVSGGALLFLLLLLRRRG